MRRVKLTTGTYVLRRVAVAREVTGRSAFWAITSTCTAAGNAPACSHGLRLSFDSCNASETAHLDEIDAFFGDFGCWRPSHRDQQHERRLLQPLRHGRADRPAGQANAKEARQSGVSTTADLNRFFAALLGERLLPERLLHEMATPGVEGGKYGLGLAWQDTSCGVRVYGNDGDALAYHSWSYSTEDQERQATVGLTPDCRGDSDNAVDAFLNEAFCG